jgi:YegS/Rv2252/BmrU family lipid kinase
MRTGKILFVINKKSGAESNDESEVIIEKIMSENQTEYELFYLTGNGDHKKILERINKFRPKTVVASGGDGTINFVASIIIGKPLKLGILPSGSANGLAFELGISEKISEALQLVITGNAKPMDVVRINEDRISLHLSDVGINARIVKEFEKENNRGFKGYIKHFFKEMLKPQRSYTCIIKTDNGVFKHRAHMTVIANASKYRTGANINPNGKIDDGLFEVIVIKPHQRWLWKSFIGSFTGKFDQQPHIETYKCSSAVISTFPLQELQVDGESLGKTGEIKVSIHKHALRVIRK